MRNLALLGLVWGMLALAGCNSGNALDMAPVPAPAATAPAMATAGPDPTALATAPAASPFPQASATQAVTPSPTAASRPSATASLPPSPTPTRPVAPALPTAAGAHRIFLDAGHGGPRPGAVHLDALGKVDLQEDKVNLDVVQRAGKLLADSGFAVIYSRQTDAQVTSPKDPYDPESNHVELQARLDLANAAQAELFISVHFNGFTDKDVSGTEVYYCADRPFGAQSKRLAQLVLDNILKELKGIGYASVNRGAKDDLDASDPSLHYFELGPTAAARPGQMPGIIGEGLVMANDTEAALLHGDAARQAIARGYAQAVIAYFQPAPTATPTPAATATAAPAPRLSPGASLPPLVPVPPELVQGDASKHQIALTFDAGVSSDASVPILDTLKAAGVRSTMFLTGDWMKDNPALVRRILRDGHQVANHSQTHPDFLTLSDAEIQAELLAAAGTLKDLGGAEMPPYFRPPFGSRDSRVLRAAARAGYRSVYWTLDSADWREEMTAADVRSRVLREAGNGQVIVMHLSSAATAQALPEILAGLRAAGYRFVLVDQIE